VIRINEAVTTPNGDGVVLYKGDMSVTVTIEQKHWKFGGRYPEYPGKFTKDSPTINAVYWLHEVEAR
jgi:hypothetical protein